ncbi:hypothetical protein BDW42DRAFT_159146 [Aspergillus taichungensis]|uniref:Uncharacterized protein n=1 Tax=Aspergillus taichungensis TaxID=482145 RepID=A0A2J5I902_9EURO|nr:hypothetical protein BDW42DRAFT_159146 [Aspergillus taichungensis]
MFDHLSELLTTMGLSRRAPWWVVICFESVMVVAVLAVAPAGIYASLRYWSLSTTQCKVKQQVRSAL